MKPLVSHRVLKAIRAASSVSPCVGRAFPYISMHFHAHSERFMAFPGAPRRQIDPLFRKSAPNSTGIPLQVQDSAQKLAFHVGLRHLRKNPGVSPEFLVFRGISMKIAAFECN